MIAIADRLENVLPSATLALTAKAKDLKAKGNPVISLAAGEPDFPVPAEAKNAILKALEANFTKYTPTSGTPELKEAVVKKIKRDQGLDVKPNEVVISCGAKHSLYNLIQVLCSPGDEIILPNPYWVSYPEMAKLAGARSVLVDTFDTGFLLTADLIERAVTPRTKVVVLNSPSNPTGAVIDKAEVEKIARLVKSRGLFCISDEIYEYYTYDGKRHTSIATFFDGKFQDHVAIVNGTSKSYAMTGLRIGYTVTSPSIVAKIGILQDHSTSNPVSLSQAAAVAALGLGPEYETQLRSSFQKKRDLMMDLLAPIKKLKAFRPSGAFYVFVNVAGTGLKPEVFSNRLLEEKFVAAIPGESFGADEWVRLSFAASVADIQEGVRRIREWVEKL